jgi:phytoene desaturase
MHTKKAIIIGSGIAGMATAVRLAVQGFDVQVYETNSYPGGKLSAFEKDGYYFDAGPSLFMQPQNIEELFELAGEPIENYFSYEPVTIACKYFYENGKVVNAFTDREQFTEELSSQLNEPKEKVTNYLDRSARTYQDIGTVFTDNSLHKRTTWLNKRLGKALAAVKYPFLFRSLDNYNRRQFTSPEAVQLFNRFATYNGSDPYRAPAMLSLIPHMEQNEGVYYPRGGMISITNALFALAKKKGVQFHFDTPVQRIIQHEGNIKGVVVNDINVDADIVVSNADIYFTYKKLLRNEHKAKQLLRQERSSSAVLFYWGMNKQYPQLQLHNILFSNDYQKEFKTIFSNKNLTADPTVYINITSKMEQAQAPAGKENWFVMVNAPANAGQDWDKMKAQLRSNVISKLSRMLGEDIETSITTEHTLDPLLIEQQTSSFMGALYGSSSNSKLAAFLRHANFTGAVKGLYFCGGSVHPGGGIPLCLKSAKIVSELIKNDKKRSRH